MRRGPGQAYMGTCAGHHVPTACHDRVVGRRRILQVSSFLKARLSAVHDSYFPETNSQREPALSFLLNGNYQISVHWISCVLAP